MKNVLMKQSYRDVPDPDFYQIPDFTGSLIRIPDSDAGSGFWLGSKKQTS